MTLSSKVDFRRWGHLAMSRCNWWTIGYLKSLRDHLGRGLGCAQSWGISTYRWGGRLAEPLWGASGISTHLLGRCRTQGRGARARSKVVGREWKSEKENELQSSLLDASLDSEKSNSHHKCKLKELASMSAARLDSGNLWLWESFVPRGNWSSLPVLLLPTAWRPPLEGSGWVSRGGASGEAVAAGGRG